MQIDHTDMKAAVAVAWVLTWSALAVLLNTGSTSNWILLIGAGALPPLMLLKMWHEPPQTLSERIREAVK